MDSVATQGSSCKSLSIVREQPGSELAVRHVSDDAIGHVSGD
jgi:hypothetical protein